MDNRLQTFMELSAAPELNGLCSDRRASWVWSADGTRVLWANAAGASFFGVRNWSGLSHLDGLTRSPARPHIARIATEGATDRATIDRLRFYRGLRVMLLTCQCRRIELPDGQDAALIVCADKALELDQDPLSAYLALISDEDHSSFLVEDDTALISQGRLTGTPEWLDLPEDQGTLFGPIGLGDDLHEGALAQVSGTQRVIVLENTPVPAEDVVAADVETIASPIPTEDLDTSGETAASTLTEQTQQTTSAPTTPETEASVETAGAEAETPDETSQQQPPLDAPSSDEPGVDETGIDQADIDEHRDETASAWSRAQDLADMPADDGDIFEDDNPADNTDTVDSEAVVDAISVPPLARSNAGHSKPDAHGFQFIYRRRPVRFAWKMDIDQRFTFISDEFAETLGPAAADVVGLTWADVAAQFDLDVTGSISRALQRRDTWSGKTVDWPVTGEALRVPVDMAALPAFDRNREFEGYRGFGVCRTADAVDDPLAPLMTGAAITSLAQDGEVVPAEEVPATESKEAETDAGAQETATAVPAAEPDAFAAEDHDQPMAGGEEPDAETSASMPAEAEATGPDVDMAAEDLNSNRPVEGDAGEPEDADGFDRDDQPEDRILTDTQVETEPAIDLTPAPKAPLEGKTLLGASTAALLGSFPFAKKLTGGGQDAAKTEDVPPPSEAASSNAETAAATEDDDADAAIAAAFDQAAKKSGDLAGISGSAPLHPKEIETAVKTLARDFGRKPKKDDEADAQTEEAEAPASDASTDRTPHTAADESDRQIDLEDLVNAAEVEAVSETDDSGTVEVSGTDDVQANDEQDFFEETAAFRNEETGSAAPQLTIISGQNDNGLRAPQTDEDDVGSTDDADTSGPDFGDDGKVVPISRRPHLVPVDTSRLSKPEKAAFRKIAEALGARLEGDIDDELDQELAKIEKVPEAGPIDPRLLDRLPIGIAIAHDRDVLYANDTLLDLLGYGTLKALIEAGGLEAVFVEEDDETLPDADGMEGTVDDTLKVRVAGGGVRCVDARMHTVPWNGGLGLMISFTERTPTLPIKDVPSVTGAADLDKSEALRQAEDRISELDTILETATDGVLVLDRHGSITNVNRSAEALFGASRSDMEGAPLTDFLAPESHRAAADYLDGLARNGVASILNDGREVLGRVSSGGLIPLFMTIGRVSSSSDEAKFCAVLRDITQWKTAEEELTQAKRQAENASSQKSDFLAKISHEIRTPLNAIIGFSEVMMEERFGAIGNERYKEYLRDIRTSGSHIMSLINDLLDLSKIEAGKMELRFSAVSANDVINECVALMQPQANRERVIIRASLPDSVPSVVADQRSLRQIILNLLSNAIKFNKSGGQVIVSSSLEDSGEVVLRVRDTGTGMSAKDLSAALEPFRQVHTARHGGGTGLGLPLTKALVEANRASFHIDSTPDQGTLVEIRFPSQRVLAE